MKMELVLRRAPAHNILWNRAHFLSRTRRTGGKILLRSGFRLRVLCVLRGWFLTPRENIVDIIVGAQRSRPEGSGLNARDDVLAGKVEHRVENLRAFLRAGG